MIKPGKVSGWTRKGDERVHMRRDGAGARGAADLNRLVALTTAAVVVTVAAVLYGTYALVVSGSRYAALDAEMDSVVVATSQIGAGQVITAAQVDVREVPAGTVPDGALRDIARALGATTVSAIARGGVVTDLSLAGTRAETLAGRIAEERVALSFSVNQQSGVAGLVHQGDAVSVLGAGDASEDASAVVLARHARVLALDAALDEYDDAYTAVTVEVSPEESERIATMLSVGQVSLALEPAVEGGAGGQS